MTRFTVGSSGTRNAKQNRVPTDAYLAATTHFLKYEVNSACSYFCEAASIVTIGFGIWHFFVSTIWHWRSYIDPKATKLVGAIQAINFFCSLSLVLIGLMNLILIWSSASNTFSIIILLSISIVLWVTRSILQITYPQGSLNPVLRYGMLFEFLLFAILFIGSFVLTLAKESML
jgi:hypothetical protein